MKLADPPRLVRRRIRDLRIHLQSALVDRVDLSDIAYPPAHPGPALTLPVQAEKHLGVFGAHRTRSPPARWRRLPPPPSMEPPSFHVNPRCQPNCSNHSMLAPTSDTFRIGVTRRTLTSVPRRRVVRPSPAAHRRHHRELAQLLGLARERIAVENDQVGEVAGHELAASPFVAGEPGRIHGGRLQRLLDRERLLGMPRGTVVLCSQHAGPEPRERIELLDRGVGAVRDERAGVP